jgi:hypothetical protein
MKATKPNPQDLLLIAFKAAELEVLLKRLGTMPSYFNPHPADLPDLPWSTTTLANLVNDLASVTRLIDDEMEQEEWGITDDMVDEICEVLG